MRIITVGTSNICKEMIKALRLGGFTVHACVSRDSDRARDFAITNGVKFYLSDYDKALTSQNFDAVYIALPNSLHYEYARKALLAGKHVIVEKPITSSYKELDNLLEIAKARGLYVFENMTVCHNSVVENLKKQLYDIAPIRNVQASFYHKPDTYAEFKEGNMPNIYNPKLAGGSLMDLNVYNIMFVIYLFGLPLNLSYSPRIVMGSDVSGCAILHFDDFYASLNAGKDGESKSYCMISGENGYLVVNHQVSRFKEFDIYKNGALPKHFKYNVEDCLVQNTKDFYRIMKEKDDSAYNKYVGYSLLEIRTLELLAESGNLKFN